MSDATKTHDGPVPTERDWWQGHPDDATFLADVASEQADRALIRRVAGDPMLYTALLRQVRRGLIRVYGPGRLPGLLGDATEDNWDDELGVAIFLTCLGVMNGDPAGEARELRERLGELPTDSADGRTITPEGRTILETRALLELVAGVAEVGLPDLRDEESPYCCGIRRPPATTDATALALALATIRGDRTAGLALIDQYLERM